MIEGTIEVERMMNWLARQRRASEWEALSWYWRACRDRSEPDKQRVRQMYGKTLLDALTKYYQRRAKA